MYFIVFGSVSKATPNEEKKREKESLKKDYALSYYTSLQYCKFACSHFMEFVFF